MKTSNLKHSSLTSLKAITLAGCLLSSGCFYLVESGKGGVAERFATTERTFTPGLPETSQQLQPVHSRPEQLTQKQRAEQLFMQRMHKCQNVKQMHHQQGLTVSYPNYYRHINLLLTRSLRLHVAGYHAQAHAAMDSVEYLLRQAGEQPYQDMLPVSFSCQSANRDQDPASRAADQEICI